jgi:hypothetical protein
MAIFTDIGMFREKSILFKELVTIMRTTKDKSVVPMLLLGCWEFIIEHVHYINFGTRDILTYVIFGIDIKNSCISSL